MALESTVDEAVASEVSSARKGDSGRGVRDGAAKGDMVATGAWVEKSVKVWARAPCL
jgi:hypothetical protein